MFDLAVVLDYTSKTCLYEQIYEYIKSEIRGGKLLEGEQLPSTRVLADYLQVSRSTAMFAYEQLMSEGYIESRPYKGYFVCKLNELPLTRHNVINHDSLNLHTSTNDRTRKQLNKVSYDFSPNGLDMSLFPFDTWKKITNRIMNDKNTDLFMLGEPQGDYELRETISKYLHTARGVNCEPEQIVVGAGNDYLLLLLEKLLGSVKDSGRLAMENATYMRAYRIFSSFGYEIETVSADENGMKVDELIRKQVDYAYVMPSHQYPTGITMPIGRRMELIKWASEQESRYIIEDDYDSEFRYKGKPIPALQGVDTVGKVIYIGTFSKAIAPAIRVSFMVLPATLLRIYKQECFFSSTVSRIDQCILNTFIKDGYFERYLNKMRKIYRDKQEKLMQLLKPFETSFKITGEHAGLHILMQYKKNDLSEQELILRATKCGVRVYGMSDTMIQKDLSKLPTIILGYGGMTISAMEEGLQILKTCYL